MSAILIAVGIVVVGALLARPTYRAAAKLHAEATRMNAASMERLDRATDLHVGSARMLDEAQARNAEALKLLAEARRLGRVSRA